MPMINWFGLWSQRPPDDLSPILQLAGLRDDTHKRAVAVRTALRGIAGLNHIDNAPWSLSEEVAQPIKLQGLRAMFVTWCELLYDGVRTDARQEAFDVLHRLLAKLDEALPDFYHRNIMSSDYAVASWQDSVEAGRRSARLIEAIDSLAFRPHVMDERRQYRDFLDTLSLYGPVGRTNEAAWRAAQRSAIGADCSVLRGGAMTGRDLMLAPLWPSSAAAALETNLASTPWTTLGQDALIWLRERKDGALVMGKDPEAAAARMIRIANLPPTFWNDRLPADTFYAFNYTLHGAMDNPHWGSASMKRPAYLNAAT